MPFSGRRSLTVSMTCLMCGLMSSVDGCTWMASSVEVPISRLCYQWKLNDSRGGCFWFAALISFRVLRRNLQVFVCFQYCLEKKKNHFYTHQMFKTKFEVQVQSVQHLKVLAKMKLHVMIKFHMFLHNFSELWTSSVIPGNYLEDCKIPKNVLKQGFVHRKLKLLDFLLDFVFTFVPFVSKMNNYFAVSWNISTEKNYFQLSKHM